MKKLFFLLASLFGITSSLLVAEIESQIIYKTTFKDTALGRTPPAWRDLIRYLPARNWVVDGKGMLRVVMKEYVGDAVDGDRKIRRDYLAAFGMRFTSGVAVYDGVLANGAAPNALADVSVSARVQKTPDDDVSAGVIVRLQDRDNYYAARLRGPDKLEIIKVADGKTEVIGGYFTRKRITDDAVWTLSLSAMGPLLSARLHDEKGGLVSLADARDHAFEKGFTGLTTTTFGGFSDFQIAVPDAGKTVYTEAQIAEANSQSAHAAQEYDYPVVKMPEDMYSLNTPFADIQASYDIIVAGAGTGGFGAALQAARLGARVLLLEETDMIGGQMANAAVTSMDEGGFWGKNTPRERGIFREFHESAVIHYYTILKDPFTAYHFNRQSEGGFEPRVARGILYGLIKETRDRTINGRPVVLDLAVRTKVTAVQKQGDTITGATLSEWTEKGPQEKMVACKVLIDATEYGDVLPLTGAAYRVGTSTSDKIDPASPLQEHTWVGVIREYPQGVPAEFQFKEPPPTSEWVKSRFKNYSLVGAPTWGQAKEPGKARLWWTYVAWRGMPDSLSPATGELTEERHTRCGLNGGNDYAVTAGAVEDMKLRNEMERGGIYKTLGIIWWFQNILGVPWSVTEDEGYATPYQIARMRERGIREDLIPIAARLPQLPYARESRRLVGVQMVRGEDIYLRTRGDMSSKHWADAVSINDYSIDLHGTDDAIETDLDEPNYINNTGPYQIPFGAFIPVKVDGLLGAEKNIGQSRIVNGSTRLQPSTMLNGQAAGAIAALAVQKNLQPRQLNIIDVQSTLLAAGDTLVPQWYEDVTYGTPLWQATQLLSLYGMMKRPGPLLEATLLGAGNKWSPQDPVDADEARATLAQLAKLVRNPAKLPAFAASATREQFALQVADVLRRHGQYHLGDPSPYAPPYDLTAARKQAEKKTAAGNAKKKKEKKEKKKDKATEEAFPDATGV